MTILELFKSAVCKACPEPGGDGKSNDKIDIIEKIKTTPALESIDDTDDENVSITLLQDVQVILDTWQSNTIPSSDLLEELHKLEERPWTESS